MQHRRSQYRWRTFGAALGAGLAIAAAGCSRDEPEDTGQITAHEAAAFTAPPDSSLTPKQVDKYLRTALAQIQLLRDEGPAERARLAAAPRPDAPPVAARGGARRKSAQALWGDFVDATFIRSARKLGYNPAELWYVRARISVAGGQLLADQLEGSKEQAASLFRQQAEGMRGAPGVTQAQIDAMLKAAEQAEQQEAPRSVPPRLVQNLGALRRARATLSDASWGRIAGVAAGVGMSDLGRIPEAQMGRKLDELAKLHQHALANREPPPQ